MHGKIFTVGTCIKKKGYIKMNEYNTFKKYKLSFQDHVMNFILTIHF